MQLRDFEEKDREACRVLLDSLGDWFGIAASNREYIASLGKLPSAVVIDHGGIVGFTAIETHNRQSMELLVIAVSESYHRQGVGSMLLGWVEDHCVAKNAPWLHVKTRGPLTPDPGYERTRQFYLGQGFTPLFETLDLWGPQDAALIMVKKLT